MGAMEKLIFAVSALIFSFLAASCAHLPEPDVEVMAPPKLPTAVLEKPEFVVAQPAARAAPVTVPLPVEQTQTEAAAVASLPAEQTPEPVSVSMPAGQTRTPEAEAAPVTFDPGTITEVVFNNTKKEAQEFIENLNKIIRARDYKAWVASLDEDYLSRIASPENLSMYSNSSRLRSARIVLRTAYDYFNYVVVPSRANDHVGDIVFVSETRIKAYTLGANGQKLRLYDLQKEADNTWKIIN
jgi:hypothetical protein